jgi:uncharacterized membrane protein (DUF485 family)
MLHEPAAQAGKDPAFAFKRKLGVRLFWVYGLVYTGFVAINLVSPAVMGADVFGGLNLAVVYGFGLIVFALLLALAYNGACSRKEAELADVRRGEE